MKSKLLVATTAAALAAGTYYAVAQSANPGAKEGPGSMSQSQGAPKAQDAQRGSDSMDKNRPSTSGQAPSSAQSPSGPSPMQRGGADTKAPGGADTKAQSTDTKPQGAPAQRSQTAPSGSSPGTAQSPTTSDTKSGTAQSPATSDTKSGTAQSPSTAPAAGASASLSTEQRTQIRQAVISQSNAPRVNNVNFSLSVGTVVPRTVRVVVLPEPVIRIHPAWRGYSYFLVGDQIVIVEPGSLRIVAVIPA